MNGMGYVPVCSSSSMSKTFRKSQLRDYCAFFSIYHKLLFEKEENRSNSKTV